MKVTTRKQQETTNKNQKREITALISFSSKEKVEPQNRINHKISIINADEVFQAAYH